MKERLPGTVAVVTGAGRGIGRAVAVALAREGARVALAARTEADLRETQARIRKQGGRAVCIPCDVGRSASVEAMVARVLEAYGDLDLLVNNAGRFVPADVAECTDEAWEETLRTNLTGVFFCTRAVLRHFLAKGAGHVVNIVSGAGVHAFPGAAAYCASKFGVMGFSETLLQEVRGRGVRVTVVLPGMTRTGMVAADRYAAVPKIPPEEVAEAVVYAAAAPPETLVGRIDVRHLRPRP